MSVPELEPRPAATVIVLRNAPDGLQVLLLQRSRSLAFHGGAWVFPGGAVEDADRVAGSDLETARRAAVREAREESGLALDARELVPVAHWTTPKGQVRRFSTWFFVTSCAGEPCVVTDGHEMFAHRWLAPAEALAQRALGHIDLPAPTFVSLTRLSAFTRARDVLSEARGEPPFVFVPRHRKVTDGTISLYGGDASYDGGPLEHDGARHRLGMLQSGWRYERRF